MDRVNWAARRWRLEFDPMSPEEIQRTIQFLLNQQAQFAVDLEQLSGNVDKLAGKTDRIADGLIGLTGIVGRIASSQELTDQQVQQTSRTLEETGRRLEESDARLREHISRVESHLDIVIRMFERHLREDHGSEPS